MGIGESIKIFPLEIDPNGYSRGFFVDMTGNPVNVLVDYWNEEITQIASRYALLGVKAQEPLSLLSLLRLLGDSGGRPETHLIRHGIKPIPKITLW